MSLFKEVALTPHVFQKETLLNDERKFERLLNALDSLAVSGQIIGVFSDWFKFINENISQFDEFEKNEIEEALKYLNDRQRIVHISNNRCQNNDEQCWVKQALYLNTIRHFELILALEQNERVVSFDELDRKMIKNLQNQGATVFPQTQENMQNLLSPILAYAEIVKVYDPYFDLSKQRYTDALIIIADTLGYRHGEKESGILEIHTSIKIILDKNDMIEWRQLGIYQQKLSDFEKKYGHSIKFYIWEDKKDNKWHDRWIVTSQCAITLGKGSDISEWTDATWGILDYEEIPNVERKFSTNRQEFNLIATINKNGLKKENKSLQYSEYMTEEDRKAILDSPTITTPSGIRKKQKI